jgi:hypothetical protein
MALTSNGIPQAADFDLREVESPALSDGFLVHNTYLGGSRDARLDRRQNRLRIEVGDTMRAFPLKGWTTQSC